jgi:hypothetical protein
MLRVFDAKDEIVHLRRDRHKFDGAEVIAERVVGNGLPSDHTFNISVRKSRKIAADLMSGMPVS